MTFYSCTVLSYSYLVWRSKTVIPVFPKVGGFCGTLRSVDLIRLKTVSHLNLNTVAVLSSVHLKPISALETQSALRWYERNLYCTELKLVPWSCEEWNRNPEVYCLTVDFIEQAVWIWSYYTVCFLFWCIIPSAYFVAKRVLQTESLENWVFGVTKENNFNYVLWSTLVS